MLSTIEDREKSLWIASQEYLKGKINIDELEKIEEVQAEKLIQALITVSRHNVKHKLLSRMQRIISPHKRRVVQA